MPSYDPQPGEEWTPTQALTVTVDHIDFRGDGLRRVYYRQHRDMEVLLLSEFLERFNYRPPHVDLGAQIEQNRELFRAQRERSLSEEPFTENHRRLQEADRAQIQADPHIARMMQGINQTLNEAFGPPGPDRDEHIRAAIQRRGQLAVERDTSPLNSEELRIVNLLGNTLEEMLTDEFEAPDRLRRVRAEIAQRLFLRSVVGEDPQELEGDVSVSEGAPMKKYEIPKTQWERLNQEEDSDA
jgi:hypothetical protein